MHFPTVVAVFQDGGHRAISAHSGDWRVIKISER